MTKKFRALASNPRRYSPRRIATYIVRCPLVTLATVLHRPNQPQISQFLLYQRHFQNA